MATYEVAWSNQVVYFNPIWPMSELLTKSSAVWLNEVIFFFYFSSFLFLTIQDDADWSTLGVKEVLVLWLSHCILLFFLLFIFYCG